MSPQDIRELVVASAVGGAGIALCAVALAIIIKRVVDSIRDERYRATHVRSTRVLRPGRI